MRNLACPLLLLLTLGAGFFSPPSGADIWTDLDRAQAFNDDGEYEQARNEFSRLLNAIPASNNEARAWAHFGQAFARQQLPESIAADRTTLLSIIDAYREAARLDRLRYEGAANFNAGLILDSIGEDELALDAFLLAATSDHPQRMRFLYNAGRQYEKLGQLLSAIDTFEKVIATDPGFIEASKALLPLYLQLGWDKKLLESARELSSEERLLSYINFILTDLLKRRMPRAGASLAESALVILAKNHARLALKPIDYSRTVSLDYATAARRHPHLEKAIKALGVAYGEQRNYYLQPVENTWWQATQERRQAWSTVLGSLGHVYWRQSDYGLAASFYEAAIGFEEPYRLKSWIDPDALIMLTVNYANTGEVKRTGQLVRAVNQWRANSPSNSPLSDTDYRDFYLYAAMTYTESRYFDIAEKLYLKSLEYDPDFANAHIGLGFGYQVALKLAKATHHYEAALKADPNNPTANNNVGFTTLIHGDFNTAIKHLKRAYELDNYLLATVNLGDAYRYAGDFERALQYHREAQKGIRERGDDINYMSTQWLYNYMPLYKGDEKTIRNDVLISSNDEKNAFVHYALSFDNALVGDMKAAQRNFDQAINHAASPEFRCFFANKIAAIGAFVDVPANSARWLKGRQLELKSGLNCTGS